MSDIEARAKRLALISGAAAFAKREVSSVTESQVALMKLVCFDPEMSVFSQTSPKPTDPLQSAIEMKQAAEDADYLASLGFLRNITADHQERIDQMGANTGRTWRVFEISALGRAMFQAATSTTVH
jgi:hypothetical protein